MSSIFKGISGLLGGTLLRTPIVGALLGFGWIFGEYFATKILDRGESYGEEKGQIEESKSKISLLKKEG